MWILENLWKIFWSNKDPPGLNQEGFIYAVEKEGVTVASVDYNAILNACGAGKETMPSLEEMQKQLHSYLRKSGLKSKSYRRACIETLKEHGLYFTNVLEFSAFDGSNQYIQAKEHFSFYFNIAKALYVSYPVQLDYHMEITEQMWGDAIDTAVLIIGSKKCAVHDGSWPLLILKNYFILYTVMWLMCAERTVADKQTEEKKCREMEEQIVSLESEIEELRQRVVKAEKYSSQLELKVRNANIREKEFDKELLAVQRPYLKKIEEQSTEIEGLRDALRSSMSQDTDKQVVAQSEKELAQLPTTGVAFVGGNVNLVSKLKQVYPDWNYIQSSNCRPTIGSSISIVFVYYEQLSHKTFHAVRNVEGNAKELHVRGTNIKALIRSMREQYTDHAI